MTTLGEPAETAEITRPAAALCQTLLLTPGHRETDCRMDSQHKYNPVIFTQLRGRACTPELVGHIRGLGGGEKTHRDQTAAKEELTVSGARLT